MCLNQIEPRGRALPRPRLAGPPLGGRRSTCVGQEYEGKVATLASKIRRSTPPERRVVSTHTLLVLHRVAWFGTGGNAGWSTPPQGDGWGSGSGTSREVF